MNDSDHYRHKKNRFDNMLTIYGRKPVLEALEDSSIPIYAIHLADSNKRAPVLEQIEQLAQQRSIEIQYTDKRSLSRISRNSKQDQGVAADLALAGYQQLSSFLDTYEAQTNDRFLAVDNVSNPQNLGMIIRSAAAAGIRGLVIPNQGSAAIGPLVIKASAGAIFKCPVIRCEQLADAISELKKRGVAIASLSMEHSYQKDNYQKNNQQSLSLFDLVKQAPQPTLFVLGNESEGVSDKTQAQADFNVFIPMSNQVESLNVAVTAALIAFASYSS